MTKCAHVHRDFLVSLCSVTLDKKPQIENDFDDKDGGDDDAGTVLI